MPKPPSGGGGGALFTTSLIGDGTVGTNAWIDLGVIPTGFKIWFGSGQYTSPDKSITFEIRTSMVGQSTGTDGTTSLLASTSASSRSGQVASDYYKNGALHIVSVVGTGVEHFWLRLKSKSGTAGSYLYRINYTTE